MTKPFPATPTYSGWEAPLRFEGEIFDLEIEGEIPADIDGAWFRVAPDPQYPPMMGDDIFFNGDGRVSSFRIKDGHVDFKTRYVRTERFKAERAARRSLFGLYRNPYTDDPSVAGLSPGTGNTNVLVHHGKLWAIKEDSLPIAMDPLTLETYGPSDFGGQVTSETFTAHPKIDPRTGELICFGYEAGGLGSDDVAYYVIDADGKVKRSVWFKAPHVGMIHDIGVTENYVVFPVMPITCDLERLKAGGPHWQWQPDLDWYFGVLPRDGEAADVRWFRAPNGFAGHVVNAFEKNGKIILDSPVARGNVFFWWPDANGEAPPPGSVPASFERITIDPRGRELVAERAVRVDVKGEFPNIDDRYAMGEYRHAFATLTDPSKPYDEKRGGPLFNFFFNTLGHLDMERGTAELWWPGDTSAVQEPVFVPRSPDAPEGDGYVLAMVNRHAENRSDMVVLDTDRFEDGPIATVRLPVRLKNNLHGTWHPASDFLPADGTA